MSYATDYLALMDRYTSGQSRRLMDTARITGAAQMAGAQAWAAVPGQLVDIAQNAGDRYMQIKRQQELERRTKIADDLARTRAANDTATEERLRVGAEAERERQDQAAAVELLKAGAPIIGAQMRLAATSPEEYELSREGLQVSADLFFRATKKRIVVPPEFTPETAKWLATQGAELQRSFGKNQTGTPTWRITTDAEGNRTQQQWDDSGNAIGKPMPADPGTPDQSLERVEVTDPQTGKTVIKLIPRAQAAGAYEKPTPAEPVVFTERPDPAEGDKVLPGIGATPNSIFQNGIWFALTAKMPPLGMGNTAGVAQTRQSIQNTGNALIAKSGLDSATIRSAYQSNQKSMDRMVPLYNQTAAFANSAKASIDFAMESGTKVWNSKIPTVNRMRNWLSGTLSPNDALSEFEVFVYTAARDYAKVTTGGALSIAELSVSAAKKADQLLNSAQSPGQFSKAANATKRDMGNVLDTQRDQIGAVSGIMASFLQTINPAPLSGKDFVDRIVPGSSPVPPPQTGKVWAGPTSGQVPTEGMTFVAPNGNKLVYRGNIWTLDTRK